MYLSFLEVTHNGGLSADQAKNVQFVFREKAKHLLRLHLSSFPLFLVPESLFLIELIMQTINSPF